jgi:hypothetical protein
MSIFDDLAAKASQLANDPKVKEGLKKAQEYVNSEEGKKTLNDVKGKVEGFVSEKTDGKGILGFGKK